MENDDDEMIVVVVGDDDEVDSTVGIKGMCRPVPVKEEPLHQSDVTDIIATAQKYGQEIKIELEEDTYILPDMMDDDEMFEQAIKNISHEISKQNKDYNDVDSQSDSYGFQDDDYVYETLDEEILDDIEDYEVEIDYSSDPDGEYGKGSQSRNRRKMLSPSRQKSFIDELRQRYPELKKNEKALIESLVEIMRNSKPPKPPRDFYIVNGILYECAKCGGLNDCLSAATRHYQEKHGPRYLICYACGVDFRSKTNLYKHEKICRAPDAIIALKARARYLGRKARSRPYIPDLNSVPLLKPKCHKRFSCCECSATFSTMSNLVSHNNMHRGVRPHCCDRCPRAYTSASALSRHLKTHSNEQYICEHCERSFKVKAALVSHLNTHAPVPKYACDVCGQRYATKQAINHHVRRVHLGLPMPCACCICPQRYPRMSLLRDHMKSKHGMSLMTRKMFFKALPTLTEAQLQQAKAILKSDAPLVNLSADIAPWSGLEVENVYVHREYK